ncbi:MAG: nuclear transport factor 2 family protein [Acidimicrobiales bacterium]
MDTDSDTDLDLTTRISRLEAYEDIRRLVARYGVAVDDRDIDTVGSLFTEDGVFRHGDDSLVNHGRQEIVDFYTDRLTAFGPTYHYPHSHLIDLVGDTEATGVVMAHAELGIDGTTMVTALRYRDRYVIDGGQWRFAERAIAMLYYMDMAELAAGGLSQPDRKRYFGTVGPSELPEPLATWQAFFA